MLSTNVEAFTQSLSAQDVPVTRTPATDVVETLAALIETPAVGTTLPYDGVLLFLTLSTRTPYQLISPTPKRILHLRNYSNR